MADYLKIARAALALSETPNAAEAKPEIMSCAEPPGIEAAPDPVEAVMGEAGADPVEAPSPEPSLKGNAVELWRNGNRFFIVTDEQDAQEVMGRFGAGRGEVWTGAEVELVARFGDQAVRDEVARWKRRFNGPLSPDTLPKPARATRTWRGR